MKHNLPPENITFWHSYGLNKKKRNMVLRRHGAPEEHQEPAGFCNPNPELTMFHYALCLTHNRARFLPITTSRRCSIVSSGLELQSLLVTDPCSSSAQFGRHDGAGLAAALGNCR